MKRKRPLRFRQRERKIIEQWRKYAVIVAFDRAPRPIRDAGEVEGLAHKALLNAARYFKPGKGDFKGFLLTCLIRTLNRHYYHPKKKQLPTVQVETLESLACCEGCGTGCLEADELVGKILEIATNEERKLIHEYFWEEKTFKQIGEEEGLTGSAMQCRMQKCLQKMRMRFPEK